MGLKDRRKRRWRKFTGKLGGLVRGPVGQVAGGLLAATPLGALAKSAGNIIGGVKKPTTLGKNPPSVEVPNVAASVQTTGTDPGIFNPKNMLVAVALVAIVAAVRS